MLQGILQHFIVIQLFPVVRNPKVHHRVNKSQPLDTVLSLFQILFRYIWFNTILASTHWCLKFSGFPTKISYASLIFVMCVSWYIHIILYLITVGMTGEAQR